MYYYLSGALKRRLILELKDSFKDHPVYNKLVDNIQNKYAFPSRPSFGIVVKGGGGTKTVFSADNFIGTVVSHVMVQPYGELCYPIEWVREDAEVVAQNGGMPIASGAYYLEITKAPTNVSEAGEFMIDPLLDQTQEPVRIFTLGSEHQGSQHTGQLEHIPVQGTLRMYANNYHQLAEGSDFTVDYTNGSVNFPSPLPPGVIVRADYRYIVPSLGPVPFYWNQANRTTLPGVVMAFGKRAQKGDKVVIRVYEERVDTAKAYGGKFEYNFDLDVITTDPEQAEEIADLCFMHLYVLKKEPLAAEGIIISEVGLGAEAEEDKDEVADELYYTVPISVQMQGDWEVHIPLPLTISKVTSEQLDGSDGLQVTSSGIVLNTMPIFANRNNDYERLG